MLTERSLFVFLIRIHGRKHTVLMENFIIFPSLTLFELEFLTGVLE